MAKAIKFFLKNGLVKMATKPQLSHFFEIDITEYIETVKLRRNTKTFKQNDNNIVTIFATASRGNF